VTTPQYEAAGVDYDRLDAAKRIALAGASLTGDASGSFTHFPSGEPNLASRGEPAFVFKTGDVTLATVLECLGTKSVLAREYVDAGGPSLFHAVGLDAVAAIVNDLICSGALPLVVHAYFATGAAGWYDDQDRYAELVAGWGAGCDQAGAVWAGGESPTLAGLVSARDIEIAGSAVGFIQGAPILGDDLKAGDDITLVASSGLHSNGSSLVRQVAGGLDDGLRTLLPNGAELGAAALVPAFSYVRLVAELSRAKTPVSYYSHITGHGLRKVMRANKELTYRLQTLPPVPEVLKTARAVDLDAWVCGTVEDGPRRVILESESVVFEAQELQLRHH
jgi:phosphoribosylformylglycinamidine cyclo-ligase